MTQQGCNNKFLKGLTKMALVFYCRVSSKDQNLARQLARAKEVHADKIFADKLSGKNLDRTEFKKMMSYLREGDTLEVLSLDRLSRNYKDLQQLVRELRDKGVKFVSDDLPQLNSNNELLNDFMMDTLIGLMGFVAQNEREKIRERQREGIELAKKQGKYKGGTIKYSPTARDPKNRWVWKKATEMLESKKYSISEIARAVGVSRNQVYRIRDQNAARKKKEEAAG